MARLTELNAPGRLSVMVATGPSIRNSAGSAGRGDVAASGIAMSSFQAEHLNSTSDGVTIPAGVVQTAANRLPRKESETGDDMVSEQTTLSRPVSSVDPFSH